MYFNAAEVNTHKSSLPLKNLKADSVFSTTNFVGYVEMKSFLENLNLNVQMYLETIEHLK